MSASIGWHQPWCCDKDDNDDDNIENDDEITCTQAAAAASTSNESTRANEIEQRRTRTSETTSMIGERVDNTLPTRKEGFFASIARWFKGASVVNKFMFFPPSVSSYTHKHPRRLAECTHWVALARERPEQGMFPVVVASAQEGATNVVFYMHGNSEDAGDAYERCLLISEWTYSHVCIIEYPGYGPLKGQCTEHGAFTHAVRAIEDLVGRNNVSHSKVVLYGRSIGSGVALTVAKHFGSHFGGFVLQSPFSSVSDVAREHSGIMSVLNTVTGGDMQFTSAAHIKNLQVPLLIVHGRRDAIIPLEHSQALYDLCTLPDTQKRLAIDERACHEVFSKELMEIRLKIFMGDHVKRTARSFRMKINPYKELSRRERTGVHSLLDSDKSKRIRKPFTQEWFE